MSIGFARLLFKADIHLLWIVSANKFSGHTGFGERQVTLPCSRCSPGKELLWHPTFTVVSAARIKTCRTRFLKSFLEKLHIVVDVLRVLFLSMWDSLSSKRGTDSEEIFLNYRHCNSCKYQAIRTLYGKVLYIKFLSGLTFPMCCAFSRCLYSR